MSHIHATNPNDMEISDSPELCRAYQQAIDVNIISSITDTNGIITHVNRKFCEVSKYSTGELIGQNHRIINSSYHSAEFFANMWTTIKRGELWHGELRNKAKDGSHYWVDTVIIPVKNSIGEIQRFLSLRMLITDRKKTEVLQTEYTRRLSDLVEITSRHLRAPLASCKGIIDVLAAQKDLAQQEQQYLVEHLQKSAGLIDQFTRDMTELLCNIRK
jgi:PAS domain S-box-containing protein